MEAALYAAVSKDENAKVRLDAVNGEHTIVVMMMVMMVMMVMMMLMVVVMMMKIRALEKQVRGDWALDLRP